MNKSFNGYIAQFKIEYTNTGKIIHFWVNEGSGISLSWNDALETVREWTSEWRLREDIDLETYKKIALMYAQSYGLKAEIKGFRWIISHSDGAISETARKSEFKNENEALINWASPRMPVDFIRAHL